MFFKTLTALVVLTALSGCGTTRVDLSDDCDLAEQVARNPTAPPRTPLYATPETRYNNTQRFDNTLAGHVVNSAHPDNDPNVEVITATPAWNALKYCRSGEAKGAAKAARVQSYSASAGYYGGGPAWGPLPYGLGLAPLAVPAYGPNLSTNVAANYQPPAEFVNFGEGTDWVRVPGATCVVDKRGEGSILGDPLYGVLRNPNRRGSQSYQCR